MLFLLQNPGRTIFFFLLLAGPLALSADFTVSGSSTSAKSLDDAETGTVQAGATLIVGGGEDAIKVKGDDVTINNSGLIRQSSSGGNSQQAIQTDSDFVIENLVINNFASGVIQSDDDDAIDAQNPADTVSIFNYGTIQALSGNQTSKGHAVNFDDNDNPTGTFLKNFSGGLITAALRDAVRGGFNAEIENLGQITATDPTNDDEAISLKSGTVLNGSSVNSTALIEATDKGVAGTETGSSITVTNYALIRGRDTGVAGAGAGAVTNHSTGLIEGIDDDGIDFDGAATVTNSGVIQAGLHASSASTTFSNATLETYDAVTLGGGSLDNQAGGEILSQHNGVVFAISLSAPSPDTTGDATLTNSGLIEADKGYGVRFVGAHDHTLTNHASGEILGGTSDDAVAVRFADGGDTLNNAGVITARNALVDPWAVRMGEGDDTVNITGGAITGRIDGGDDTDTLHFNHTGTFILAGGGGDLEDFEFINLNSGTLDLTGGGATPIGDIPDITVAAGATLKVDGLVLTNLQYLFGSGTVQGDLALQSGAKIAPGNSPGILTLDGDLDLAPGSILEFELNGLAAGSGYDQILFTGPGRHLDLDGATLSLSLGFTPAPGDAFVLLDGFSTIAGSFAQGSSITAGGVDFAIAYHSGDITLTAIPEPSQTSALLASLALLLGLFRGRARARRNLRA